MFSSQPISSFQISPTLNSNTPLKKHSYKNLETALLDQKNDHHHLPNHSSHVFHPSKKDLENSHSIEKSLKAPFSIIGSNKKSLACEYCPITDPYNQSLNETPESRKISRIPERSPQSFEIEKLQHEEEESHNEQFLNKACCPVGSSSLGSINDSENLPEGSTQATLEPSLSSLPESQSPEREIAESESSNRDEPVQNLEYGNAYNIEASGQDSDDFGSIFPRLEAELYLRRNLMFFATLFWASFATIYMIDFAGSFQNIFAVLYCYLGYCLFDNIIRNKYAERDEIRRREDFLALIDTLFNLFFLVCVNLKFQGLINFRLKFCLPFSLMTLVYPFISTVSRNTKIIRSSVRALFAGQALFVALKLTGSLDWDWVFVFVLSWIYLFVVAAFLFSIFFAIYDWYTEVNAYLRPQKKGLLWHFLYYSLSLVALIILLGLNQAYSNDEGFGLLKFGVYISLFTCGFLAVFTVLYFPALAQHIQEFWLPDGSLLDPLPEDLSYKRRERIEFKVEKKESYFMMMSSTFYRLLQNHTGKSCSNPDLTKEMEHMKDNEESNLCYLCYEEESDAILMNCGHGGVCYKCVVPLIKKKNQCMECRSVVDVIHKIDLKLKNYNVLKAVEQLKVIKK